jgi:hypothetical protein
MLTLASRQTDPIKLEALQRAGAEIGNRGVEGFGNAQTIIEAANSWDDEIRDQAVLINLEGQSSKGIEPLSFGDATKSINNWINENQTSGDEELKNEAISLSDSLRRTQRGDPGAVRDLLRTIETNLKEYANSTESRQSPGYNEEVSRLRNLRDAVYKEAKIQEKRTTETNAQLTTKAALSEARSSVEQAFNKDKHSSNETEIVDGDTWLTDLVKGSLEQPGPYNQKKGVEIMLIMANQAGLTEKTLIEILSPQFEKIKADSKAKHPEKPIEAHEAFASKQVLKNMEQPEEYSRILQAISSYVNSHKEQFGSTIPGTLNMNEIIIRDFLKASSLKLKSK